MTSPLPKPLRVVQSRIDADMRQVLESTAKSIRRRIERLGVGIGAEVRAAQLRLALTEIDKIIGGAWAGPVLATTQAGRKAAAEAAETAADALTAVAYNALPPDVAKTLTDGLRASAQSAIKNAFARVPRDLSARVYRNASLTQRVVHTTITEGLAAGLSARELAKDVYQHVSPTVPGGMSYAAMRLARTELNNAFHERQKAGADRPGVKAIKWNLSGSHKVPDECNVYAAHEPYDKNDVPDKPHPQCFCFLTYIMMTPAQFARALEAGSFDDEIDRRTRENMARLGQPVGTLTPPPKGAERHLTVVGDTPTGRVVPDVDNIKRSVKSGIVDSEKLAGGVSAETTKVKFKDGSTGVRKFIDDPSAKRQQDAEELIPLLARMMGMKGPQVTRVDEKTTIQQFLTGKPAVTIPRILNPGTPQAKVLSASARVKSYVESDTGWLMGVMDQITGNQDRHDGNWLIEGDEIVGVIDHGLAYHVKDWRTKRHDTMDLSEPYIFRTKSEFTKKFAKTNGDQTNIDFHPEDLDAIRDMMETLKPEYEARGRLDWWQFSIRQIEALRPFAKGKKRRIV